MNAACLHLVLPGLLGPWSDPSIPPRNLRLPGLETLLVRAERGSTAGTDPESVLFGLFGLDPEAPPIAAVSRLGEGLPAGDGHWLRAAPVRLRPDMDRLLLFDSRSLDIQEEESRALIALFNGHFADRGWRLEAAGPARWYLHLETDPGIETSPLHAVNGRSLFPFLPRGADALHWHGLLNEAQMLLFHAPVNQQRRAQGRPEIGGLWVWGGGVLPRETPVNWRTVLGRDPLLEGLSRLSGSATPQPATTEALDQLQGDALLYRDELFVPVLDRDPATWAQHLAALEPLFRGALAALRSGRVRALLLYPCTGHSFRLTRDGLRRFWRRSRPLAELIDQALPSR